MIAAKPITVNKGASRLRKRNVGHTQKNKALRKPVA
jgi:hypothetical protein